MNTMLLVSAVLIVVGVCALVPGIRYLDDYSGWGMAAFFGCFVGAGLIIVGIVIPLNVYGGRAYGRVECRNWGHQTGRPAKFAVYTSWDTGTCLTRDAHGRWVSKDQIREFASAS